LGEYGARGFLERNCAAEDLTDRVEEIDLLVPFRQFVPRLLDLECRLQVLRDDRHHEAHVALEINLRHRAWTEPEPGPARARYGRDENLTAGGVHRGNSIRWRGENCERRCVHRARLGHDLPVRALSPHRGLALRRRAKRRQDSREVRHWRIMIRRTVFPRACYAAPLRSLGSCPCGASSRAAPPPPPPSRQLAPRQKLSSARSRVSAIWKRVSSFVSSNSVLRSSFKFARRSSPPCSRIFF